MYSRSTLELVQYAKFEVGNGRRGGTELRVSGRSCSRGAGDSDDADVRCCHGRATREPGVRRADSRTGARVRAESRDLVATFPGQVRCRRA